MPVEGSREPCGQKGCRQGSEGLVGHGNSYVIHPYHDGGACHVCVLSCGDFNCIGEEPELDESVDDDELLVQDEYLGCFMWVETRVAVLRRRDGGTQWYWARLCSLLSFKADLIVAATALC